MSFVGRSLSEQKSMSCDTGGYFELRKDLDFRAVWLFTFMI